MRVCSSGFGVVIRVRVRCVGSLIIILRGKEGKKGREKGGRRRKWWESGYDVHLCWLLCGVVVKAGWWDCLSVTTDEREREILSQQGTQKKTGTQIPTNQLTEY